MDHTVFIQTNHKQITGAIVAEYALRRYSTHNDRFDVRIVQRHVRIQVRLYSLDLPENRGP